MSAKTAPNQISRSQISRSWKGFLPPHAVLMAKRGAHRTEIAKVADWAEVESPTVPASLPEGQKHPDSLAQISAELQGCPRCKLCTGRTQVVVGGGSASAQLVFVGAGPNELEDREGRPFSGSPGHLLDKMIEAMGMKREDVYITNLVKCRVPEGRYPETDELSACSPFLDRQFQNLQPKVVVAFGGFAAQTLLQTNQDIAQLRGRFHDFRGMKLMPTYHPAHLLENPASKRETWEDLKSVAKELGIQIPVRTGR